MKVENMLLVLTPSAMQCQGTMDSPRDHVNSGRLAKVRPTHVRLPPVNPTPSDEVDEEKDNAFNLAVRYQNPHSQPPQKTNLKRSSNTRSSTSGQTSEVADKRSSMGPLTIKVDASTGQMMLCSQSDMIPIASLSGQMVVINPDSLVQRTKSSGSSSSSCSSVEDPTDIEASSSPRPMDQAPDAGQTVFGDVQTPPVPPRSGVNCYENIPVPGIIRLSKSSAEPVKPHVPVDKHQDQPRHVKKDMISLYSRMSKFDSAMDKARINRAVERLKQSGFYFDMISAADAKLKLRSAQVGTFLVRVSSQSSHLFALSVKTNRGTTSIRLTYEDGNFRLDADPQSASKMPAFECIIALIEYYVVQSASDARNKCVFLESNGRRDTPVILTRPLREQPQSLKHLCRRNLHYHHSLDTLDSKLAADLSPDSVQLKLRQYLSDYPYAL